MPPIIKGGVGMEELARARFILAVRDPIPLIALAISLSIIFDQV
jgi:hypothetical protein